MFWRHMDTLGQRIKGARLAKEMTQQAVTDAMKAAGKPIDVSFVALMETDRSKPSIDTLAALATVLSVDANYLLEPLQAAYNGN